MKIVTPQMYGAKADGITDDTEAFQKAVDSGFDVFVPTALKETYLITKPIRIAKTQCKRIFSEPISRPAEKGAIIFDLNGLSVDPKTVALFDIHNQMFTVSGLRFISRTLNGFRAGILFNAMDENVCDYDIRIDHCYVTKFYKVISFTGRGLEITDCKFGSCQFLADLYWNDEKDTNKNHPAKFDQRGISIKDCRLHNIVSGFLTVRGHAYGLHFTGNTIDNGSGYLILAFDQAYGWNITGNVIQGIHGLFDVMDFRKGMSNCVITGNTFISDIGYWVGTTDTIESWLNASGMSISSVISNNVFKNAEGSFLAFKNMEGLSITGNAMRNKTGSTDPAISIGGTCTKCTFVGNAVDSEKNIRLISKTNLPKENAVIGNYPTA